jgi:hypothetical protein
MEDMRGLVLVDKLQNPLAVPQITLHELDLGIR